MTGQNAMANIKAGGLDAELCLDPKMISFGQGTMKLEQKVSQLFETSREPIYRYLAATFVSPAEAEEITQEVFLKLYQYLYQGKKINNIRAWLFRVAHNLAVDYLKDKSNLLAVSSASWDELCHVLQDSAPNPEQVFLQQEKYKQLHEAIESLSPQQWRCLHLRAEGFRYREIAEILDIHVSSVYEYVQRSIKILEAQIDV